jgi:hypothetical protein
MTDDRKKTFKEEPAGRLEKAKGRLQQSFPEIQHLVRTSNALEVARKIIDPAQLLFRQFADDIQLKDLIAKAESLVANANLAFTKTGSKEPPPEQTFRDETPSNEPSRKAAAVRKKPSKAARLKKAAPKKTPLKNKKKPAPKRKVKTRS